MAVRASVLGSVIALAAALGTGPHAAAQAAQDRSGGDGVINVPAGDPAMERAYAQARGDLAGFLALAAKPQPGLRGFSVKVGFSDPGQPKEFFWIGPFERQKDGFAGRLGNRPVYVRSLREGQTVRFAEGEIVDWMYFDGQGRMHGNRTACVLLAREDPAELRQYQQRYGLDCSGNGQ